MNLPGENFATPGLMIGDLKGLRYFREFDRKTGEHDEVGLDG